MKLYALDTETGGFKPDDNALLSISLVELDAQLLPVPDRILDLFILPCADRTVSPGAAQINGYTPELWEKRNAVTLVAGFAILREWLGKEPAQIIAHNAKFDQAFVSHYEVKAGIKLPLAPLWACTVSLSRDVCYRKHMQVDNHKLETMARLCGHWKPDFVRGAHGAREDALACAAIYRWAQEQLGAGTKPKPAAISFADACNFRLTFGMYKGQTLDEIAVSDRGLAYCDWLLGEQGGPTHDPALKAALEAYLADPTVAADLVKAVRK
jgi:DNA polymerase III epsilon subunit-like protein